MGTDTARIPFVDLEAQQAVLAGSVARRIAAVLDHGQYVNGPEVTELEQRLAARTGAREVVACASGTDALVMALMALGVGPGDAVLVPAFTFVATAEAVVLVGASPVFCDVLPDTFDLDPAELEAGVRAATTAGLRPVGVVPVDLFGQPADYGSITPEAARLGLWVLADGAQSMGGAFGDRPVGALAPMTATSFFPAKPLGGYGDGGAVFVESSQVGEVLRSIREHGKGSHRYEIVRVGLTGRLDTIQAAVLLAKLEIFDNEISRRRAVADRYTAGLGAHVRTPAVAEGAASVWAQYTLRIQGRDAVADRLDGEGIPTAVYYPRPLHLQAPYRGYPSTREALAVSEGLSGEVLSLPMHPYLDAATQDRIIESTLRAVGEAS